MSDGLFHVLMKILVPNGKGGFFVHDFVKDTEEGAKVIHDTLEACGWADASQEDYDNFMSAAEAVGEIAGNVAEYARIESLDDESKVLVRGAVQGDWKLAKA